MKRLIPLTLLTCFTFFLNAQEFEKRNIQWIKIYPVLQNGGRILGIDELFVTITDLEYNRKHDIYKISGFVPDSYYKENSIDSFDIDIYDSTSAVRLYSNLFSFSDTITPICHFIINRYGLFTIYLKEKEIAEINTSSASYPTRLMITPNVINKQIKKEFIIIDDTSIQK